MVNNSNTSSREKPELLVGSLECKAKELKYYPVIVSADLHSTCSILGIAPSILPITL